MRKFRLMCGVVVALLLALVATPVKADSTVAILDSGGNQVGTHSWNGHTDVCSVVGYGHVTSISYPGPNGAPWVAHCSVGGYQVIPI